jgi:hypothetical protein
MTDENIGRQAAEIGLDLTPAQLAELAEATALIRQVAEFLPYDLPLAEEPALTLRLRRRQRP